MRNSHGVVSYQVNRNISCNITDGYNEFMEVGILRRLAGRISGRLSPVLEWGRGREPILSWSELPRPPCKNGAGTILLSWLRP